MITGYHSVSVTSSNGSICCKWISDAVTNGKHDGSWKQREGQPILSKLISRQLIAIDCPSLQLEKKKLEKVQELERWLRGE